MVKLCINDYLLLCFCLYARMMKAFVVKVSQISNKHPQKRMLFEILQNFNTAHHRLHVRQNIHSVYLPLGVRGSIRLVPMYLFLLHESRQSFLSSDNLFCHCPGKEFPFHPSKQRVVFLDDYHCAKVVAHTSVLLTAYSVLALALRYTLQNCCFLSTEI